MNNLRQKPIKNPPDDAEEIVQKRHALNAETLERLGDIGKYLHRNFFDTLEEPIVLSIEEDFELGRGNDIFRLDGRFVEFVKADTFIQEQLRSKAITEYDIVHNYSLILTFLPAIKSGVIIVEEDEGQERLSLNDKRIYKAIETTPTVRDFMAQNEKYVAEGSMFPKMKGLTIDNKNGHVTYYSIVYTKEDFGKMLAGIYEQYKKVNGIKEG